MTDTFKFSIEQFRLVTMLDDRSVRVDLRHDSKGPGVHYSRVVHVYKPDHEAYQQLLEITGIKTPGDCYSYYADKRKFNDDITNGA
jgi:hypothetical protein